MGKANSVKTNGDSVQTSANNAGAAALSEEQIDAIHADMMNVVTADEFRGQGGSFTYDPVTQTRTRNSD